MNVSLSGSEVTVSDDEMSRTMSLEQYEKHARDTEFVAAIRPADHRAVLKARAAQLKAEAGE